MSNLGEGIENEARENGFVAGRLEDIHAMFNAGISTKDIAKCFKMPWNKVEKIVEDNIILTEDDFKEELSCEDRVKILKDEFQIDLDEESLDTFQEMCRLREELTQHGIKIGWQEGKKDDALKMFKAGYDVSFIARITRLSPDEIEDIIHNA